MVWMMWLVVLLIFHQWVHSGMCSAASWSTEYVHRRWQDSGNKQWKAWFNVMWLSFQRQSYWQHINSRLVVR